MGMTDRQFKGFIRMILDTLKKIDEQMNNEDLKRLIENLQAIIED